jgi:hypothetical chaperone protein
MNMLNGSKATAFEPEKIQALIHLIKEDLGYELHRAVQRVKVALSTESAAAFQFADGVVEILGGHPKPASRGHLKTGQLKRDLGH